MDYKAINEIIMDQKAVDKKTLLEILIKLQTADDEEADHKKADKALLRYINDPEITEAYNKIKKWYA